ARILLRRGYATRDEKGYRLTIKGRKVAARLVRVHRLWEVYLDDLGLHGDSVHENAAEMEHIISDEFEESLSAMLGDPKKDPHNQPIPQKGEY
ncbi:MAG: iron dependent repressor, metal binding and dimerization domain protein, partial [Simkaniaceae bacterium]|nr:iron dependent repressor, metal binding and dimerization domain protein [Simkaniaceae bacterium]